MQKETSIYLDAVRFAAACLVVIYHAYGLKITGGFLWWLGGYGPTSVMVFLYYLGMLLDLYPVRRRIVFLTMLLQEYLGSTLWCYRRLL